MVRVRFAPSPTGPLHVGGARTALFNYLIARNLGGTFILRIDDTDLERSLPEHEKDIYESLKWLGLAWDEGPDVAGPHGPYRQSERREKHIAAGKYLVEKGKAYQDAEGVVRLRYPNDEVVVEDKVCGRCVFQPRSLGPEPVLLRSDGTPTYHLASVSDDIEMGITHVVRGQDHLTNTAKHLIICQGLGHKLPEFAHLPLILGEDGTKLSKRSSTDMTLVSDFYKAGYLPEALINFLLLLGWSHPEAKEHLTLEEAIGVFTVDRIGKTASIFETAKLQWLNKHWLKHVDHDRLSTELRRFLPEYEQVLTARGKQFWNDLVEVVRSEILLLSDVKTLAPILFSLGLEITPSAQEELANAEYRAQLLTVSDAWEKALSETALEDGKDAYTKEQFQKLTSALKKSLGLPPKVVFHGVRLAITGAFSGPELHVLVPLIPRQVLLERAHELKRTLSKA